MLAALVLPRKPSHNRPVTTPTETPLLIAVVVPLRNEAGNVLPLLAEITAALGARPFEVVCVDDGSDDATPNELAAASIAEPRLKVLRHRKCCGQSAAILTGIRAAKARFIATLDGDGQNDPADIPRLLATLQADSQPDFLLVAGWRRRRNDPWLKRVSSRIANGVRRRLLRDNTPDTGCGLKVFTRSAFLELPWFDHIHRYLPALMLRRGSRVVSMEVNHRPRERGRTKYGVGNRLWVSIGDLMGVMWLMRRAKTPEVMPRSGADA